MSNISNLFSSASSLWTSVPNHLYRATSNIYQQTDHYFNSASPNLNKALRYTVGGYDGNVQRAYTILSGMCSILMGNKPICFVPHYRTISSEEAETLTMHDILEDIRIYNNRLNIHIYMVPRGKTYLKNLLDNNEIGNRLKAIETFAIEDPTHFIRIYKGIRQEDPHSITVFTDRISEHIIYTLIVMFPNLFNIVPVTSEAPEEEAMTAYNTRVGLLRTVFENLYKVYTGEAKYDDAGIRSNILAHIVAFSETFNWVTEQMESFVKNLSNARNTLKLESIIRAIRDTKSQIQRYENDLERSYTNLNTYNRELAAFKALAPDDMSAFFETLKNTKAIEILDTTNTRLTLRVTAPLQYFTPSDFEIYERNSSSYYHQAYDSEQIIQSILHKIFVTREYKLMLQAVIRMDINNNNTNNPVLHLNVEQYDLSNYTNFPNPHLYHFNCWSEAINAFNKFVANNEFDLALLQIVAAVQSVNVAEGASFINRMLPSFKDHQFTRKITIIDENNQAHDWKGIQKHETEMQLHQTVQPIPDTVTETPKKAYTQVIISEGDDDDETHQD